MCVHLPFTFYFKKVHSFIQNEFFFISSSSFVSCIALSGDVVWFIYALSVHNRQGLYTHCIYSFILFPFRNTIRILARSSMSLGNPCLKVPIGKLLTVFV